MSAKAIFSTASVIAALALLAACGREGAPAETVEAVAEDVARVVEEVPEAPGTAAGAYAPRDDCADLPGSAAFLRELYAAIDARDADALAGLAAEDIKLDFGGGSGTDELRRRLTANDGALWRELDVVTRLGCAINSQGGVTLPWYFEHVSVRDPVNGFVVMGEDVPLLEAPRSDSAVVAMLSWDAVELVAGEPAPEGFRHVRLASTGLGVGGGDAVQGYVAASELRSLIDYRLVAASRNGTWRVISLLKGD